MDIKTFDNKVVKNYLTTLVRHDVPTIPMNIYLRKPYIESYIIIVSDVHEKYEELEIDDNDFYMYIYDNISLNTNEKKVIQNYIISNGDDTNNKKRLIEILLLFIQSYFKYYMIITELLYEKLDELYDDIFSYVNNDNENINYKINHSFNFQIFYYYTNKLLKEYENMVKILIRYKLLERDGLSETDIRNLFIKNLFSNWYAVYKKNGDPKVIKREKKSKRKLLSQLFCVGNIN